MLVRDVLPLLSESLIIIVNPVGNEIWKGRRCDVPEEVGALPLKVLMVDYDLIDEGFVVYVDNRCGDFHEIGLLLSDCLRYADEGRGVNYVAIMHLARRVAQIAETNFARMIGR